MSSAFPQSALFCVLSEKAQSETETRLSVSDRQLSYGTVLVGSVNMQEFVVCKTTRSWKDQSKTFHFSANSHNLTQLFLSLSTTFFL